MIRQGPHHSAHASTSTGCDEDAAITSRSNEASVTACGLPSVAAVRPVKGAPHLPQTGCIWRAALSSTRFFVPHCGHALIAIVFVPSLRLKLFAGIVVRIADNQPLTILRRDPKT